MVWLGHYQVPFSSSCHSRSLTAPTAQMPLWKLCCIFLFVREIFTKIPLIVRQVQTVLWRKSKFVCRGNPSAWSASGCWIIAGGWFQSQHWTPNFHYQFVPNNTILSPAAACLSYTSPLRQFLCITHRLYRFRELTIAKCTSLRYVYLVKQGSAMCGAICPDVLAWRDTGSSPVLPLSST